MKYPKEYLDEIKLRLKVSQVVSKTVQLKKRGKEFIGLSPFKNEKPIFYCKRWKRFYHCFSSGEHGNIFDFLMKTKSIGLEKLQNTGSWSWYATYGFQTLIKKIKISNLQNIYKEYSDYFIKNF